MRDSLILFAHLLGIVVRLAKPGGLRSVVAESVLVRHQLLILNRGRKRAPKLRAADRIITGLCTLFIRPARLVGSTIVLKLSTLLYFHNLLRKRKYRMLFSPQRGRRPGPKGPEKELIGAVVEMKRRNPNWGSPRIAQQIALAFGVAIDKDMVRRILSVQAGLRFARSLLAHRSGPYEGQFVELRSVPLHIGNPENPLGSGRDGPLYASDHRVWRAPWRSRRRGAVPDVSASDWRSTSAKIPQLGSRSAIQVPSMAG